MFRETNFKSEVGSAMIDGVCLFASPPSRNLVPYAPTWLSFQLPLNNLGKRQGAALAGFEIENCFQLGYTPSSVSIPGTATR